MKTMNTNKLKQLTDVLYHLSQCNTEDELKKEVMIVWAWLAVRTMAGKEEPLDTAVVHILESIEQLMDWGIPTLNDIKAQHNPPDDE